MDVAQNVSSLDFTSGLAEYLRGGNAVWAYLLLAATTAPPLVPNSVLLVTGGVLAAQGRLDIALVLLVVAGSAVVGDMLIHRTGGVLSGRVLARMSRRPRQAALLNWSARRIERYGIPFVIAVRFLPSGRVVGGLAAGVVRYPARRYVIGAGVAELVWASYSVGAGYFSGRAASNSFYALTLGLGISLAVAGLGTVVQWISARRDRRGGAAVRPSVVVAASPAGPRGPGVEGRVDIRRVLVPKPSPPPQRRSDGLEDDPADGPVCRPAGGGGRRDGR